MGGEGRGVADRYPGPRLYDLIGFRPRGVGEPSSPVVMMAAGCGHPFGMGRSQGRVTGHFNPRPEAHPGPLDASGDFLPAALRLLVEGDDDRRRDPVGREHDLARFVALALGPGRHRRRAELMVLGY